MAASAEVSPQSAYVQHHLAHLNNTGHPQTSILDMSVINYDSVFWSLAMGLVVVFLLWLAARRATNGVPGRFQAPSKWLLIWSTTRQKALFITKSRASSSRPGTYCVLVGHADEYA